MKKLIQEKYKFIKKIYVLASLLDAYLYYMIQLCVNNVFF